MEHWIVYDVATGAPLYPGSGSHGAAALQMVPEGSDLLVVPPQVMTTDWPNINLAPLRASLAAMVDQQAEQIRMLFLTDGAGQAMTYTRKEAEARARLADPDAPTPFLSLEAVARGMTVDELAAEVVGQADQWVAIGSAIEALRMGAKSAIAAASTLPDLVTASTVDWQAIGS